MRLQGSGLWKLESRCGENEGVELEDVSLRQVLVIKHVVRH